MLQKASIVAREEVDFRGLINEMIATGQVIQVDEQVDWNLEASAVWRYCAENNLPAALFTNLKDSIPGMRVIGGLYASHARMAMACGLPADTDYHDLVDWFIHSIKKRIKPVIVERGACQENVITGADVNLLKLPVPLLHPRDGGGTPKTGDGGKRYLATLSIGVCKDLDSDWVNWGTYRGMIHDANSEGIWLGPFNHGGQIIKKYNDHKQVMEYVQFMGGDPLYQIAAASSIPYGVDEVDVVGGMRGRPVSLVKCKTVDLYVPADAEIVIEGTIRPNETKPEGPFGEGAGYMGTETIDRPLFRVSAITHRNNPILTEHCLGVPADEGIVMVSVGWCAYIKEAMLHQGLPIDKVSLPVAGAGQVAVVSTKWPATLPGMPQRIASTIWADRNGAFMEVVIVVDDDIDPHNWTEVLHVIATKCNPAKDIHIYPGYINTPLAAYLAKTDMTDVGAGGGNVLIDCTWPFDWKPEDCPDRLSFRSLFTEELKHKVVTNVKRWGFEKG